LIKINSARNGKRIKNGLLFIWDVKV